jgi:hypothetical protein
MKASWDRQLRDAALPGRFVATLEASWDLPLHKDFISIHLCLLARGHRDSFILIKHVHSGELSR